MRNSRSKAARVWLRRIGHCRGFGIQSPGAYSFVRYVVNEHYPYYAYERLRKDLPGHWLDHKMGRLLLRLANYWQPRCVVGLDDDLLWQYVHAGCKRTLRADVMSPGREGQGAGSGHTDGRRIVFGDAGKGLHGDLSDGQTMLVVRDIGTKKPARRLWQQILSDERATATFDLYWCGIAFFDSGRTKQNYIVNF